MDDELGNYLTAKDAAEKIGITYPTLFARIRKGKINGKKHGYAMFIHKDEVERVKKEQQHANNKGLEESTR